MAGPLRPNYTSAGDCWPLYDQACRIDEARLREAMAREDNQPRHKPTQGGCPMCGCPTRGQH